MTMYERQLVNNMHLQDVIIYFLYQCTKGHTHDTARNMHCYSAPVRPTVIKNPIFRQFHLVQFGGKTNQLTEFVYRKGVPTNFNPYKVS